MSSYDGPIIVSEQMPRQYPVQLALAYLLLVGYLARTIFVSLRLPASVGVILTGFLFSYFMQSDIFFGRDLLQELAFFLVLLTAGLEISLQHIHAYVFVVSWLPCSIEVLAIATYTAISMDYTFIEGLNLGCVLVAIGDGLVIPKMKEFSCTFPQHPMPHLMLMWAPLEASFALTLFGVLTGVSAPASMPDISMPLLVCANILRVFATVAMGALLGRVSSWLVEGRSKATMFGHQVFTGYAVEAFLILLAVALASFGLGADEHGHPVVPMIFSGGSLFQPELLVIVTGSSFAMFTNKNVLQQVEQIMGGVWIFGQLILFSMLGSRTSTSIFPDLVRVFPIMVVGLTARLFGVSLAMCITRRSRGCELQSFMDLVRDSLFCFLATLPRATIQGALGAVPINQRFFHNVYHKDEARHFIFTAARLYIVCFSTCGMIMLNTFGPLLLTASSARPQQEDATLGAGISVEEEQIDMRLIESASVLAEEFDLDVPIVLEMLQQEAAQRRLQVELESKNPQVFDTNLSSFYSNDSLSAVSKFVSPVRPIPPRAVSEPGPGQGSIQNRSQAFDFERIHRQVDSWRRKKCKAVLSQFDSRGPSVDEYVALSQRDRFNSPVRVIHTADSTPGSWEWPTTPLRRRYPSEDFPSLPEDSVT